MNPTPSQVQDFPPAAQSPLQPGSSSKKGIGAVWLTIFIDLVGFSMLFPLVPGLMRHYMASDPYGASFVAWITTTLGHWRSSPDNPWVIAVLFGGAVGSIYALLQSLASPVWGRLSDRYGRKPILRLTCLGMLGCYLLWAFAPDFRFFLLARALGGVMAGNLSVASAAMADLSPSHKRSQAMALVGVAFGVGFMVGPVLGAMLQSLPLDLSGYTLLKGWLTLHPFSVPALGAALLALVNVAWISFGFGETNPFSRLAHRPAAPLETPLALRAIRRGVWANFFFTWALSALEFTLTFLCADRFGFGPKGNALLFLVIGLGMMLTQGGLLRWLLPVLGEKAVLFWGLGISGLAFVWLGWVFAVQLWLLGLLAFALGVSCFNASLSGLVSRYSHPQTQGLHMGRFRSAGSFARSIGPITGAMAYFCWGPCYAYSLNALGVIVPALLCCALHKPVEGQP
jgi:MFS family permease